MRCCWCSTRPSARTRCRRWRSFPEIAGVTGLVMTKLDGTARGGILVAIAARFGLPVHFIGVGEGVDDLEPFAARDFARAVAGIEGRTRPRLPRRARLTSRLPRGEGGERSGYNRPCTEPDKAQAQSRREARPRYRAAGAVLRRQCAVRHLRRAPRRSCWRCWPRSPSPMR